MRIKNEDKPSKEQLIADLKQVAIGSPDGVVTRNFYRSNGKYGDAWEYDFPKFKYFLEAADLKHSVTKTQKTNDIPIEEQDGELLHYKAKAQQLESSVRTLLKKEGMAVALIDGIKNAIDATEPYPKISFEPLCSTGTPIAAVIKLSDWQIGEVVSASETEGFGEFNFAIAEQRVFKLVEKVIKWVNMHRKAGYNIRTLHVFSEGDLVSGSIHYELEVTNEWPVTVAAVKGGRLLAEAITRFAPHFDEVTVWQMSADNHGRLTRKNQAKQGAINNYTFIGHTVCNELLSKHDNVKIVVGEGTKLLADVLGKKFLISHGHHIISSLGTPYYGLDRDKAREAVKRQNTDKTFDYVSIGHFHVPAIISGNILVNGSLPGTTEFDHMLGRYSPPSQVSFMVHPVHGIFDWTAWKLS